MRLVAIQLVVLGSILFGGCGVVFVPARQRFPGPVRIVMVLDDETGRPLRSANVAFEVYRHRGWTHDPPLLRDAAIVEGEDAPSLPVRELKAKRVGIGSFVFESQAPIAWAQWYYPFKKSKGRTYYRDYKASVRATAPGHWPLVLQYAGARTPPLGWSERAGNVSASLNRRGVLTFRLRKRVKGRSP